MQILLNVVILLLAIFGMIEILRYLAVISLNFKNSTEGVYVIIPGESDVEFSVRAAVERIRWRAFEKQYSIVVINDQLSSESEMIVNRIAEQDDNIKFYDYGQLEEYLRNMRLKDK